MLGRTRDARVSGPTRPARLAVLARLVAVLCVAAAPTARAGPLPTNVTATSSELGLKTSTESCAVGDVVYMPGDDVPGASACDRCACAGGRVRCDRVRCDPRPGCKAIHRPDHCCPTYQCECEQEGRVYGNGEKLVDPADPCRVCYCQGGEVVCRRIACFLRDDCRPRLVPGRCCPEYDNCPLRGVTTLPGLVSSLATMSAADKNDITATTAPPSTQKEVVKQEITIKEITPVSEIPVLTGVKIKEILPSPSIEVPEYSSSKSPLTAREVNTEKPGDIGSEPYYEKDASTNKKMQVSSSSSPDTSYKLADITTKASNDKEGMTKNTDDLFPSKISLSTQDSINSDIYPSNVPTITTLAPSSTSENIIISVSTKGSITEEEDTSLFDHNPAFPPLPDDLSVMNHADEVVPESPIETENPTNNQEVVNIVSVSPAAEIYIISESTLTDTTSAVSETQFSFTEKKYNEEPTTIKAENVITESKKDSPMLNLRSAIPTEFLNLPSSVVEDINGEIDEEEEVTKPAEIIVNQTVKTTPSQDPSEATEKDYEEVTQTTMRPPQRTDGSVSSSISLPDFTRPNSVSTQTSTSQETFVQEQTTSSTVNSNIATDNTGLPETSSVPIETKMSSTLQSITTVSDINSIESSDAITEDPIILPTTEKTILITTSPTETSTVDMVTATAIVTELKLSGLDTSKTTPVASTDDVEVIKEEGDGVKNAAIVESSNIKKNNVLTDLINLVGDVASIGNSTDNTETTSVHRAAETPAISDSEELIPVNAGYKSKNNNWNPNSITEVPLKSKTLTPSSKLKTAEIEGEDDENITDSPAPFDKVEPTTKRPIIDNVSDNGNISGNKTSKTDIEIISQSYVPTISKRPTKVVMKKNSDKVENGDSSSKEIPASTFSSEVVTEEASKASSSSDATTPYSEETLAAIDRITESY